MDGTCSINGCIRDIETYCYHCSRDVCTKHYLEHKNRIQAKFPPFVAEVNVIYDRLLHKQQNSTTLLPQYLVNAYNQLYNWRENCLQRIDFIYKRVRNQIEDIAEIQKKDENEKSTKIIESLEKLRRKLKDLSSEGDITYKQIQILKQQLDDIKNKEQELKKYPDIRIITQKIDVEKCVHVTTDIKYSTVKQQQIRKTPSILSNK